MSLQQYYRYKETGRCTQCGKPSLVTRCAPCSKEDGPRAAARYLAQRKELFSILGDGRIRCMVPGCPVTDMTCLEIDHVFDDGHVERKKTSHRHLTVLLLRIGPDALKERFQALCGGHNRQKATFKIKGVPWSLGVAATRLATGSAGPSEPDFN